MRLSRENSYIGLLISYYWIVSIIQVTFRQSSSYLPEIIFEYPPQHPLSKKEWIFVRKTVKGVRKISPLFAKRRKCLMEALIAYKALKKLGIVSFFHIGASNKESTLSTHAWLSVEDRIVIGGPENGYKELVRTQTSLDKFRRHRDLVNRLKSF